MNRLSRTQAARYLAGQLHGRRETILHQAAAWLQVTGRKREIKYLARDIAAILAGTGYLRADITSARPLGDYARRRIEAYLRQQTTATHLELAWTIDQSVIGGVKIVTPLEELDSTVRYRLERLG